MTIETRNAQSAKEAVEILNSLNFRQVNFEFHGENYSNDYKIAYRHFDGVTADGKGTCFGLIEIVIDGKLDTVRFINTYRETAVDIKIGDANYTVDDKGAVELIDSATEEEPEMKNQNANAVSTPATIETKIAKNGAAIETKIINGRISRCIGGKQVRSTKAFEAAYYLRNEKAITVFTPFGDCHSVMRPILTIKTTHDRYNGRGFNVFMSVLGSQQMIFTTRNNERAKEVVAAIENAFFAGVEMVEINADASVVILDKDTEISEANVEDYAVSTEAQDAAIDAETKLATNTDTVEADASEYAISQAAFDIAVKAERDNAFNAKPSLERYKSARCIINHTIDKRGRHMWFDSYGIIRKQEAADILSVYYGLTVDEYLACEKIAEAEYLSKLDAAFKARDVEELAAEYAVTVDAQEVATEAEIELANDTDTVEDDMDGVTYCNGEFYSVYSYKYRAELYKDFRGKIRYFIFDKPIADYGDDENYNHFDYEVSREKFFSVLKQRGAFTDDETEQATDTPRITDKDFLNEATFTMTATEAAKAVSTLVDNFRHMGNFHEVTLSKPDNEVLWKRTFRGTGNGTTYLIEEVLNHPDGTLREVWIRGDVNYMGIVTIKISDNNEQATDTGDKVNTDRRELIIGEETERVCVTISVKDCFNADNEDDIEILADLEHEIDWIPDVIRYRVDAEAGVYATASDDAAIRSIEELFDKYGLNYSRYVFREKVTVANEPEPTDDEPEFTDDEPKPTLKTAQLIVDKKKKTAIITIVEFVYCLRGDDFMANLGVTRYGITVGWNIPSGDGKVSKTYNGLNFASDVASLKADEANEFVGGLETMASLTSDQYSAETVDINQNNAVENRGA